MLIDIIVHLRLSGPAYRFLGSDGVLKQNGLRSAAPQAARPGPLCSCALAPLSPRPPPRPCTLWPPPPPPPTPPPGPRSQEENFSSSLPPCSHFAGARFSWGTRNLTVERAWMLSEQQEHQRRILENGSSVTPPTLDGEWAVLNGTVDLSVL